MELRTVKIMTAVMALLISAQSGAASDSSSANTKKHVDVTKDLDTLGGNDALMEKAKALDPDNRSHIVQKRTVDRNLRLELGLNYGYTASGDTYLKTQDLGANMDLHLTPRWSVGLRYQNYGNQLTPEGQRAFDEARAAYNSGGTSYSFPDVDYPLQSAMGVIDWYPVYGKTNFLDMGIAQFDMYLLAGGGQIQLSSGWTSIATAGLGVAVWISQHVSARAELTYQNYHDQIITGPRAINAVVGSAGIGILL